MTFVNLWIDPSNVACVFMDCATKNGARITIKQPPTNEIFCDLASAQALVKHLEAEETKTNKK